MTTKEILLITDPQRPSEQVASLESAITELGLICRACCPEDALNLAKSNHPFAAAVLTLEGLSASSLHAEIKPLLHELNRLTIQTLVLADPNQNQAGPIADGDRGIFTVDSRESIDMFKGRLAALRDVRGHIQNLYQEIQRLKLVGQPLSHHFQEVNEEMHLAARLQRDFLPKSLPELPGLKFTTVFRPATWVSGDIYDIMRLDEEHVGFYVADAVGHGMPAALLTIFIKRALITKRITGHNYELVDPGEALMMLNNDLLNQHLSDFQFVTCCYGILNYKTLELRIANGGHPMPLRIDCNHLNHELDVRGSLLGVFDNQSWETQTFQLHQGDKLLLYSDGVELAFTNEGPESTLQFRHEFAYLSNLDIESMCNQLAQIIDMEEGSLHPRDDVTIVGLQIQ